MGSKKNPFYRIVVADSRAPRNGRLIEEIGYYNPLTEPKILKVDADKANTWVKNGAKPTATVERLFKENAVYEATGAVDNTEVQKARREEEKQKERELRAQRDAELEKAEAEAKKAEEERKAKEAEEARLAAEAQEAEGEEEAPEAEEAAEETEEAQAE